jgi:hypothetical protein
MFMSEIQLVKTSILGGEFLVLVSAAFFNIAAVYPVENMTSETSVGRKQTWLPSPRHRAFGHVPRLWAFLHQFSRQGSWCEALPSSVGNRRKRRMEKQGHGKNRR